MKKWLSTFVFLFCLFFSYPIEKGLSKISALGSRAFDIMLIICIVVYIWYIISSIHEMKHGDAETLLMQAVIIEIPILLIQILLLVLVSVVGIMNLVAAVIAIPIAYLLVGTFNCVLGFAGTMRGISGVVAANKSGRLSTSSVILNGILQFVPFINIIDCIVLKIKIRK